MKRQLGVATVKDPERCLTSRHSAGNMRKIPLAMRVLISLAGHLGRAASLKQIDSARAKSVTMEYDRNRQTEMASLGTDSAIDWMQCELIECVPGKVSGRPVVRGTRIMPEAIAGSYNLGETLEELREGFPTLTETQIKRLIEFAHAQRGQQR